MNHKMFLLVSSISLFSFVTPGHLPADSEVERATTIDLQATSLPEVKFEVIQNFIFPLLQGKSSLTSDNNLDLTLTADITPISLNGSAEAVFTPIAFLQVVAGVRIGSGWHITLFGSDLYGIGVNRRNEHDNTPEVNGSAFGGLLWGAWGGGAFQFDVAALVPGVWNHVVFRSYHEMRYKGYTAASSTDSWYFEDDDGQNRNGFNYYGNYLLGYQMPLFFDTLGFIAEMDLYLYDTPNREDWGDNLSRWTFGPLFHFNITEKFSAALLVQFRTRRNYETGREDDEETKNVFYQDRELNKADPRYVTFYRAAVMLSYKLR